MEEAKSYWITSLRGSFDFLIKCYFLSILWETRGLGSEGSAPRTSQKGARSMGGSSNVDPKG